MKTNKLKLAVLLSTFVALTYLTATPVNAGVYGAYTELPSANTIVYVPAGIEGLAPQVVITLSAMSGVALTSFLIKKTK
ncbi:MAG: hypothetical protein AUJ41_01665 [Candidatus Pacebacteria bacterium CG1_02_43_31]|nr:MAG: hypothetical protein AUJ41_01665 [Candidatus Pacebacteria bacterium CG1_02_43_31]